jgi:AcrR family transcriptional regulator
MSGHAYHAALAETKRSQIVAAARALFLRVGYGGATLAEISKEAQVSIATLYRHFDTKDTLFAAVVEAQAARFADTLGAVELPKRSLRSGLRAFGRVYAELLLEDDSIALARVIIAEAKGFPDIAARFLAAMKGLVFHQLADYLAEAIAAGSLRKHRLEDSMGPFLGYIERSFLLPNLLDPNYVHPEGVVDHVSDIAAASLIATFGLASSPTRRKAKA